MAFKLSTFMMGNFNSRLTTVNNLAIVTFVRNRTLTNMTSAASSSSTETETVQPAALDAKIKPISARKPNQQSKISTVKSGKTLVDGIKLHWNRFGSGPHVALCLPGLVGSIVDNFLPVSKKMNLEKFTLIAWDPPGYGKSRPPDRDVFTKEFCLARDARLAGGLMSELGYAKYSLIGWSNGGITGALLAAYFPDNIHKLIMCNSPLKFNSRSKSIMEVMVDLDSWTPSQRKALLRTYEKSYALKMLNDWKKMNEMHEGKEDFFKFFALELSKIRAATLFIKGVEDIIVPMEDAEEYGKLIKNFKLHKVLKGGHDHLEFLEDFVAATESFLDAE